MLDFLPRFLAVAPTRPQCPGNFLSLSSRHGTGLSYLRVPRNAMLPVFRTASFPLGGIRPLLWQSLRPRAATNRGYCLPEARDRSRPFTMSAIVTSRAWAKVSRLFTQIKGPCGAPMTHFSVPSFRASMPFTTSPPLPALWHDEDHSREAR